jgi:hypothetical protein
MEYRHPPCIIVEERIIPAFWRKRTSRELVKNTHVQIELIEERR